MANIKHDNHFIPGFLIGAMFSMVATGYFFWQGPIQTRDDVISENRKEIIDLSKQIDILKNKNNSVIKSAGRRTKRI